MADSFDCSDTALVHRIDAAAWGKRTGLPAKAIDALWSIADAARANNASALSSWDFTEHGYSDPCTWKEVHCSNAYTRVSSVTLDEDFGGESLPEVLHKLETLVSFSASSCNLTGTLPRSLGCNTDMEEINLSNNHFTGGMPGEWANLDQLTSLVLSNNLLDQPIQAHALWPSASQLNEVRLDHNKLPDQHVSYLFDLPLVRGGSVRILATTVAHNPGLEELPCNVRDYSQLSLDNDYEDIKSLCLSTTTEPSERPDDGGFNISVSTLAIIIFSSFAVLGCFVAFAYLYKERRRRLARGVSVGDDTGSKIAARTDYMELEI